MVQMGDFMLLSSIFPGKGKASPVSGISFHDDGVALACIQRDKSGHVVMDTCEFLPLEPGKTHEQVLDELVKKHRIGKSRCVFLMLPGSYTLLHMEAPGVPADELRLAVKWRIKDLIDFHVDDAVLDVFDIPGQSERGRQKMMYVVVAKSDLIQQYVDYMHAAGLQIEAIDITELAMRNLVSGTPQDAEGAVLLDFGRHSGMISLTRDSMLYLSREIPIGMDHLRQAAGAVKSGNGSMSQELHDLLARISLEIQRSLDYHDSHSVSSPMRHILIAPMEQEVPGLAEFLGDEFRMPVAMLDLNQIVDSPHIVPGEVQSRCCATIGAALRKETATL